MRTILVPVDFSSNSLQAVNHAVKLAVKLKAKVELLHVYMVSRHEKNSLLGALLYGDADIESAAEKKIYALAKKYSGKIKVTYSFADGIPGVCITDHSKKIKADIIIIGRSGKGSIKRFFTGSTTTMVLRRSKCKVMVIPPATKFRPYKRIVFATDMKNDNLKFVNAAARFAKLFGAELVFLYVDNRFMIHSAQEITTMTNKMKSKTNYKKISGYVCNEMSTGEGISYFLKHQKADLLAVVSRHHPYPQALWSKSVSRKIAQILNIPMLVFEKS